jgi:hypothetical protein
LEVGICPKVPQEAPHRMQQDVHLERGMNATQVGVKQKAVEIVLFMP